MVTFTSYLCARLLDSSNEDASSSDSDDSSCAAILPSGFF